MGYVKANDYPPLRELVFLELRDEILRGELAAGERLAEPQLAERLGVSRTPVREAIRKLELEGLARVVPRKGAIVASITKNDLEDLLEVRRVLEGLTMELACKKMTEEELAQLEECCKEFEKAVNKNDLIQIAKTDVAFHDVIYKASRNQRLNQVLYNLREQMYRYRLEYIKDEQKRKDLVEEHKEILQSLRDRDETAAKKSIKKHIRNQEKTIVENLKERQPVEQIQRQPEGQTRRKSWRQTQLQRENLMERMGKLL